MWLPGFDRWEIPGRAGIPYDEYDDPKCMWHSTQGTSIEGAVSAYSAYPPQLIVDPRRKRKIQHISLARAGYALWNEDVDDSRCVQVEVVGFSEDAPYWSNEILKWLGEEVARPLHEHFGVPYVAAPQGFKAPFEVDYVLASASSPLRFTQHGIDTFSGHLAHQHSPGDSHWDVPLNIGKVLAYAQANQKRRDQDMPILIQVRGEKAVYVAESTVRGASRRHIENEVELNVLLASGVELTMINAWDLEAFPERGDLDAQVVWNYETPMTPGDAPEEFKAAHQVLATVNQNTTPVEAQ